MSDTQVMFLAVGKLSIGKVVASHKPAGAGQDFYRSVQMLLGSNSIGDTVPNDLHLRNGPHTIHVSVDTEDHVFCVVTPVDYPRRLIFAAGESTPSLMRDFSRQFVDRFERDFKTCTAADQLTKKATSMMKSLADKFSNVEALDKLAAVQANVNDVQAIMQDNIGKVLDRGERLDQVEGKTETLAHSANKFNKRATEVRRAMQCRYYKLQALCVCLILIILAYIIIPIVVNNTSSS